MTRRGRAAVRLVDGSRRRGRRARSCTRRRTRCCSPPSPRTPPPTSPPTLAGRPLRGVNAYAEAAAGVRRGLAVRRDRRAGAAVHRRMRLYRLDELAWPDPAPDGAPRVAADADVPLLTDWFTAFAREVHDADDERGPGGRRPRQAQLRRRLGLAGGRRAGLDRRRHPPGGRDDPGRPGLHAAGAPRPRLRQRRHRRGQPARAAKRAPRRCCSTPTWPIRCPIPSTSGSVTAPVEDRVVLAFSVA